MWDQEQYFMAACLRGHIRDHWLASPDGPLEEERCGRCGAPVITGCPSCQTPMLGSSTSATIIVTDHRRPNAFCRKCGEPMPWATRDEHITALQNRLEFEQLDRATQLAVIDELAVLWKPADESTDAEKVQAMKRLQTLAPPLWETAKTLLVELLTEKARQQLGL